MRFYFSVFGPSQSYGKNEVVNIIARFQMHFKTSLTLQLCPARKLGCQKWVRIPKYCWEVYFLSSKWRNQIFGRESRWIVSVLNLLSLATFLYPLLQQLLILPQGLHCKLQLFKLCYKFKPEIKISVLVQKTLPTKRFSLISEALKLLSYNWEKSFPIYICILICRKIWRKVEGVSI